MLAVFLLICNLHSLSMGYYGLIAQSVEHCTGTAQVMGLNPVQA